MNEVFVFAYDDAIMIFADLRVASTIKARMAALSESSPAICHVKHVTDLIGFEMGLKHRARYCLIDTSTPDCLCRFEKPVTAFIEYAFRFS